MAEDTKDGEGTGQTSAGEFEASWKEGEAEDAKAEGEGAAPESEPADDPVSGAAAPDEGTPADTPASKEGEGAAPAPAPASAPVADPQEVARQARRSELGRIQAQEKGLDRMRVDYRSRYGSLPTDETPEQKIAREAREAQIKEVDTKLPEVRAAIDDAIERSMKDIVGRTRDGTAQQLEDLEDRRHFETVAGAHSDFEDFLPPEAGREEHPKQVALLQWIQGQPYAVGTALMAVYDHGYPDEVNMMLSAFKDDFAKAQGSGTQQFGGPDPQREEQARNLSAVPATSVGLPRRDKGLPVDANFEEAWEFYAEEDRKAETADASRAIAAGRSL